MIQQHIFLFFCLLFKILNDFILSSSIEEIFDFIYFNGDEFIIEDLFIAFSSNIVRLY